MIKEKIQAYKIISHQFLTLVRMEFLPGFPSPLKNVFEIFQQRNLDIRFLVSDLSSQGGLILNIGVDLIGEAIVEELIDVLREINNQRDLALISQVSMAMVYGPHFGEVPGIAGLAASNFISLGIIPLAISASSSSLTCVFPSMQFKPALEILHAVFEVPAQQIPAE